MTKITGTHTIQTGSSGMAYILMAAATLVTLCRTGLAWEFTWKLGLLCILLIISISDIRYRLIPNRCILAGLALWACSILSQELHEGIRNGTEAVLTGAAIALTCLVIGAVTKKIRNRSSKRHSQAELGRGDIKLLFLGGLIAGPGHALTMILAACILGLLTAAIYQITGQKRFPFGPAIAIAITMVLFI